MTEVIFTCLECEANFNVGHLPQPVKECPVCSWKPSKVERAIVGKMVVRKRPITSGDYRTLASRKERP